MTAILVRMRVAVWRRTPNELRFVGIMVGAALALGVLWIASGALGGSDVTGDLLALVFVVWLLGWIMGPIQTGGADFLRPEWFGLVPIEPRRLARGMLIGSAVGIGSVITIAVLAGLVVLGARLSPAAAVVGILAAALTLAGMIVASKLVAELLGAAAHSRIATEITALQYGVFIAFLIVGWGLFDAAGGLGEQVGGLPDAAATVVRAIPPGWGVVAVEAAGSGDWLLAVAAIAGLAVLVWLGVLAWSALLERRTGSGRTTATRPRATYRRILPATPFGAVASKELRTWFRDPRRGIEVRGSLWAAAFTTAGMLVFLPDALPFAGVAVAALGAMACVNVYAMDGTAMWHTLLTPGAEHVDVRGRQLAWLLIFTPAAVLPSAVGVLVSQATWTIPWVAALLPALLGGAAGLIALLSVYGLAPETDAHKRTGNPTESGGEAAGLYFVMMFAVMAAAIPAGAMLALSVIREQPALAWVAVAVGVVSGLGYAWGFGLLTYRRLRGHGPELLLAMRVGKKVEAVGQPIGPITGRARIMQIGRDTCLTLGIIALLPQALVPAIAKIIGSDDPSWFAALHVPEPWQWPTVIAMAVVGGVLLWAAFVLHQTSLRTARAAADMDRQDGRAPSQERR